MKPATKHLHRRRQKGAILVFCLVFLAVLTTLGVTGMESTILEERMSGKCGTTAWRSRQPKRP